MDKDNKNLDALAEEQKADAEALKETHEDELRASLAAEFGFSPDEDGEVLDKLVQRELGHKKNLSTAIKQKQSWRQRAESFTNEDKPSGTGQNSNKQEPDLDSIVSKRVSQELSKRELESLNLPDSIKTEVEKIAKFEGISVNEAANSDYIKFKVDEFRKAERIKNATPSRSGAKSYSASYDPSKPPNPGDFDFSTEEGRKAWNQAKSEYKKQQ